MADFRNFLRGAPAAKTALGTISDFKPRTDRRLDAVSSPTRAQATPVDAVKLRTQALENTGDSVLRVTGALVQGTLEFEGCERVRPLYFENCSFESPIVFRSATLISADFRNCVVPGLMADDCSVEGSLYFRDGFVGEGAFLLRGLRANGSVHFTAARVVGGLNVQLEQQLAIDMSRSVIGGSVFLNDGFEATGQVRLRGARIANNLDCRGGQFRYSGREPLVGDSAKIAGDVFLSDGFSARGKVNFSGASIGQKLICNDAVFDNSTSESGGEPEGNSLDLRLAHVGQSITLEGGRLAKVRGARFIGGLSVVGAKIDGDLILCTAKITGCDPHGSGAATIRDLFSLGCRRAQIGGSVFLDKAFEARGEVDFSDARIGGSFRIVGATFESRYRPHKTALNLKSANVAHAFVIRPPKREDEFGATGMAGDLDLRNLHVTTYIDDSRSWPQKGHIRLDGFTYATVNEGAEGQRGSFNNRLAWLRKQRPDDLRTQFVSQPWAQLRRAYVAMGDVTSARRVAVEKGRTLQRSGSLSSTERAWLGFIGLALGYGYKPGRAFLWSAFFVAVGWLIFAYANQVGAMSSRPQLEVAGTVVQSAPPTPFDAMWFAIDAFIPLLSLGPEAEWHPNSGVGTDAFALSFWLPDPLRDIYLLSAPLDLFAQALHAFIANGYLPAFYYGYVILGWITLSMMIAAFSGLLRDD